MSDKLTKADVLAKAVRVYLIEPDITAAHEALWASLEEYEAAPAESDQAIEPIPDNLDEPIFKLEDGSLVTGGRAASLLNDERRFHKDTLDELAAAQARIVKLDKELNYEHGRHHLTHERAEKAEARIAELEKSEDRLITQRDHAHDIINELCDAAGHILGHDFEWTSHYGFDDAVEDVGSKFFALNTKAEKAESRVAVLEKALADASDVITRSIKYIPRSAGNGQYASDDPKFRTLGYAEKVLADIEAAQPSREKEGA